MTAPLSPEREAEIRARAEERERLRRDGRAVLNGLLVPTAAEHDVTLKLAADVPDLLAALDHERAETKRLRDVIDSQARLLSCVGSRRAALAAPTPEETP